MGEAGRKRVVENFDYRVVAQKLVRIISSGSGKKNHGKKR
jgi:hypothetical protein